MPNESSRRYLFVAINRAARWVFINIYADQSENSSVDFLAKARAACPVKIVKLLTDNGSQFTDRFTAKGKNREPSGRHLFDRLCKQFDIEHRLIPPRHPQTNGMVERFNGRISDIVNQTQLGSAAGLESTLRNYVKIYNHNIPQRALKHQTPIQSLKQWHAERPELFNKPLYNQRVLTFSLFTFLVVAVLENLNAPAYWAFVIATTIPSLSVGCRRLHDTAAVVGGSCFGSFPSSAGSF